MNPLISIIVPVYKVEKYLDRCLESIVNQTYTNLEIILVDDGSPDNCPAMCDAWAEKDNRIRVIHKENGGLFFARFSGIQSSRGQYVSFVDGDDTLVNDAIEYLYALLSSGDFKVSAACIKTIYNEYDKYLFADSNIRIKVLLFDEIFKELETYDLWSNCCKLYDKSVFDYLSSFGDYYYSEDLLINYYVFKNCKKVIVSNAFKYCYFRHEDSIMSRAITEDRVNWQLKIYEEISNDLDKHSKAYCYHMGHRVKNDLFLITCCFSEKKLFLMIRDDLIANKQYAFLKDNNFSLINKIQILMIAYIPIIYIALKKIKSRLQMIIKHINH